MLLSVLHLSWVLMQTPRGCTTVGIHLSAQNSLLFPHDHLVIMRPVYRKSRKIISVAQTARLEQGGWFLTIKQYLWRLMWLLINCQTPQRPALEQGTVKTFRALHFQQDSSQGMLSNDLLIGNQMY